MPARLVGDHSPGSGRSARLGGLHRHAARTECLLRDFLFEKQGAEIRKPETRWHRFAGGGKHGAAKQEASVAKTRRNKTRNPKGPMEMPNFETKVSLRKEKNSEEALRDGVYQVVLKRLKNSLR